MFVCEGLLRMRQSFLTRRERLRKGIDCDCDSCAQLDNLSLKFVAHQGEVAEQRVKRRVELAGVDVILVHRVLKNQVPVVEYVLMTDVTCAIGRQLPTASDNNQTRKQSWALDPGSRGSRRPSSG